MVENKNGISDAEQGSPEEIKSYQWVIRIICRFGNEQSFQDLASIVLLCRLLAIYEGGRGSVNMVCLAPTKIELCSLDLALNLMARSIDILQS